MMQRDYILRLIEEACQVLARVAALRGAREHGQAEALMDEQFEKLIGLGPEHVAQLPENELFARIIAGEPTLAVREKCFLVVASLKEAGEVYSAQGRFEVAELCWLKALNLLLETRLRGEDSVELPAFLPKVEDLLNLLPAHLVPAHTRAALMQHYERAGDFRKAAEELDAMIQSEPDNERLVRWGILFFERLRQLPDETLGAGELPRSELDRRLGELEALRR